jgi:multiple sugar transport system permease protein
MRRLERFYDNKKILPYLLLVPVALWLAATIIYPILDGIRLSFFDVDIPMEGRKQNFVFLRNYLEMFAREDFWNSCRTTLVYTISFVAGSTVLGMASALLMNIPFRGKAIARAAIIIPWAMPYVVAALVWRWILDYHYGVLNFFLKDVVHLIASPIDWIGNPSVAIVSVIAIAIWKEFPIATLMFLAGLQSVPEELYEAAQVDGANEWMKFTRITLPSIRPITMTVLLLLTIWGLKRVTVIYVLTKGGPVRATETLVIQSYLQAFEFFHMSYAAAVGTFMLIVSLAISILYLKIGMGREHT